MGGNVYECSFGAFVSSFVSQYGYDQAVQIRSWQRIAYEAFTITNQPQRSSRSGEQVGRECLLPVFVQALFVPLLLPVFVQARFVPLFVFVRLSICERFKLTAHIFRWTPMFVISWRKFKNRSKGLFGRNIFMSLLGVCFCPVFVFVSIEIPLSSVIYIFVLYERQLKPTVKIHWRKCLNASAVFALHLERRLCAFIHQQCLFYVELSCFRHMKSIVEATIMVSTEMCARNCFGVLAKCLLAAICLFEHICSLKASIQIIYVCYMKSIQQPSKMLIDRDEWTDAFTCVCFEFAVPQLRPSVPT